MTKLNTSQSHPRTNIYLPVFWIGVGALLSGALIFSTGFTLGRLQPTLPGQHGSDGFCRGPEPKLRHEVPEDIN